MVSYLSSVLQYLESIYSPEIESEIKFCIDSRAFLNSPKAIQQHLDIDTQKVLQPLLAELGEPASIEQSMRFINTTDSESMIIHERGFDDGKQNTNKKLTIKKYKVTHPLYGISNAYPLAIPYKITFSKEEKADNIPIDNIIKNAQQVRVRLRITYNILPQWRIDITLTKILDATYVANPKLITPHKEKMFPQGLSTHNFKDLAPWTYADTIEIETEYTGQKCPIEQDLAVPINFIIDKINNILLPNHEYQIELWKCAKLLERKDIDRFQPPNAEAGLKQLSTQVVSLTKAKWAEIKNRVMEGEFTVSDKPDGDRCLVIIPVEIFVDDKPKAKTDVTCKLLTYKLDKIAITVPGKSEYILIIDAERVETTLYVFDVLVYNNVNITRLAYLERYSLISNICKVLNMHKNPITFEPKWLKELNKQNYKEAIRETYTREKPYGNDGLIFTPAQEQYATTIYKWKDPDLHNTIDFLIMKAPDNLIGIHPYENKANKTLYVLFSGIKRETFEMVGPNYIKHYSSFFQEGQIKHAKYFPIQFAPSDDPYAHRFWSKHADMSGKIGEFLYKNNEWVLLRFREDRMVEVKRGQYFGNDIAVAEDIWRCYTNPLTLDELLADQQIIIPNNAALERMKQLFFGRFANSQWAIDMSAQHSSISSVYVNDIQSCLFISDNPTSLDMLVKSKYDMVRNMSTIIGHKQKHQHQHQHHHLAVYTQTIDLMDNWTTSIETIKQKIPINDQGVDVIYYSDIHRHCKSRDSIVNIITLIHELLGAKGSIILVCVDSRQYLIGKIADAGQKITHQGVEQYAVNMDYITKAFSNRKIRLSEQGTLDQIAVKKSSEYENLLYFIFTL
jgi:hypothetical protein